MIPLQARFARSLVTDSKRVNATLSDLDLLRVLPVRDRVNGCGAEQACRRHDFPCQFIAVVRIEDSSRNPRRSPLTERVSHDDQCQQFAERRGPETLRRDEGNQHIVRAHGEAKYQREGPGGNRLMGHTE